MLKHKCQFIYIFGIYILNICCLFMCLVWVMFFFSTFCFHLAFLPYLSFQSLFIILCNKFCAIHFIKTSNSTKKKVFFQMFRTEKKLSILVVDLCFKCIVLLFFYLFVGIFIILTTFWLSFFLYRFVHD